MKMTAVELAAACKRVATQYKTAYLLGCFGWPSNEANIQRAVRECSTNGKRSVWLKRARAITGAGFLFDCVNLIKAILWGWNGDLSKSYGGGKYKSNGVPDIGADAMFKACSDQSRDWSRVEIGEALWCTGHIGVYIGDGLAVECTPAFKGGVQITAVANIGCKDGYPSRNWLKHGKLPYVTYSGFEAETVLPSFNVGDVVEFAGGRHYTTAGAATGPEVGAGACRITAVKKGVKHPYHVIHTADSTSRVYGWVDAENLKKASQAAGKQYRCVPSNGLNVRSGCGTQFSKVGAIPCGAIVTVSEVKNGWGYITQKCGWAAMSYLQEV